MEVIIGNPPYSTPTNMRRIRAEKQKMKITYYNEINETEFQVGVIGNRKLPYIINFLNSEVSCSCPDYTNKTHKPICKHIYFIINLSKTNSIFNNVNELSELQDASKICEIKQNLINVIDEKKLKANENETNTILIERDDYCSVCMGDLDNKIDKCSQCKHVFHYSCLTGWWNMCLSWNSNKGRCPHCRCKEGFSHLNLNETPWDLFSFNKKETSSNDVDTLEE